ncbi:hypothetical protein DMA11_18005 [Marinilabiliaceae bacterium JC017]|nr:hypothetical protein DMA11_18005 [Marinilabiliaceae bacterium JC017]
MLLLINTVALAQEDEKRLIISYIDKIGHFSIPEKGVVYHMNMNMVSFLQNRKMKPSELKMELFMTSDMIKYTTGLVTVYQDSLDCFVVIHKDKKIFLRDGGFKLDKMEGLVQFQKKLITHSRLVSCNVFELEGNEFKRMRFRPEDKIGEQLKIKELEFVYDPREKTIESLRIKYQADNPVAVQVINYNEINFNYKGKAPSGPAAKYFFKKNGALQDNYAGYQLIDNRLKNNG